MERAKKATFSYIKDRLWKILNGGNARCYGLQAEDTLDEWSKRKIHWMNGKSNGSLVLVGP